MDTDLTFAWGEAEVPLSWQWQLQAQGYNTLRKFVKYDENATAVRASLVAACGLDPAAAGAQGPANRLVLACILSAWEVCSQQLTRELELRAESKALNVQRPLLNQVRATMRRAIELIDGRLPDAEIPSAEYLASKSEEAEQDEPRASSLDDVTSLEDVEETSLSASLDLTGKIQIIKKKGKVALPTTPEDLRTRLRVEANTWLMLASKHTNRRFLHGLTRRCWEIYTDHFLGKKVLKLYIPEGAAFTRVQIPWTIIVHYEFECRRRAFKRCREEGALLVDALLEAIQHSETKEVHFTTPLSLGGGRQAKAPVLPGGQQPVAPKVGPNPPKQPKGKGRAARRTASRNAALAAAASPYERKPAPKSKGKGKGKRQSKSGAQQICYAYNNAEGCSEPCPNGRLHVCQVAGCQGAHPAYEHGEEA